MINEKGRYEKKETRLSEAVGSSRLCSDALGIPPALETPKSTAHYELRVVLEREKKREAVGKPILL
jgi:hypothetical protein